MNLDKYNGKKIAILGLGMEGLALSKIFKEHNLDFYLLDKLSEAEILKRGAEDGNLEVGAILSGLNSDRKILGSSYLENLSDFRVIFRSPGIPYLNSEIQKARARGAEITSQIKLFFQLCPSPIIGVTGTKGKGTTASLIYKMLTSDGLKNKVYLVGNIGKPAISLIDQLHPTDFVILELSSFQLQDLDISPHIAVVLNISVDHLDYHQDENEYKESKINIVKYQTKDDFVVINQDYLTSFEFGSATDAQVHYFSGKNRVDEGAYVRDSANGLREVVLATEGSEEIVCNQNEIKLVGEHNLENIAAAAAVAKIAGASLESMQQTAKEFEALPHRLEFVREIEGVKYYNDSFATNPDPTMAAIQSFKEPKIIILGGSYKGAEFSGLAEEIKNDDVKAVVLIGDEAKSIELALQTVKYDGKMVSGASDMPGIIQIAKSLATAGDIVLLSPACASFGMFKNYKDRGDLFRDAVNKL